MTLLATKRDFKLGLDVEDFESLDIPFLNQTIRTSQATVWFEDRLVLGTGRAPLGFLGRFNGKDDKLPGGDRSDTGGSDLEGAQIVVFDPAKREWQKAYDSPVIEGRDGKPRARDRSMRAGLVCQTASDTKPCVYFGVGSLEKRLVFIRSEDGLNYQECAGSGFNLEADIPSARSMACLDGKLFCTPTGKSYNRGMWDDNMTDHPIVFQSTNPMAGEWVAASEPGFGESENKSINELIVFNDHLYAATLNPRYGFQLWKTDAQGTVPYRWTKILDRGAWRGSANSIPVAVKVFQDTLYISATIQRQGRAHLDHFGPFASEMMRVYKDDSWDLVCGTQRFTPSGIKRPLSGLSAGFGDLYTHVLWRMAIHDGLLYCGTAGWRWMPTYLRDRPDLSDTQFQRIFDATERYHPGEFTLWVTADGIHWDAVTRTGFPGSSPQNYGIREMVATPHGLFVMPTARTGMVSGGGLELWWGHRR
jgi:hypothetical protein